MNTDDELRSLLRTAPEPPRRLDPAAIRAAADQLTVDPRRFTGHRRMAMAVVATAAGVAALAIGLSLAFNPSASRGSGDPPQRPAPVSSDKQATCAAGELRADIYRRGSTASAPFLVIRLTSMTRCSLYGFPNVEAFAPAQLPVRTVHGTYEVPGPRPALVTLTPKRPAYFTVGTTTASLGTATETHLITKLSFAFTGQRGRISLLLPGRAALGATSRPNSPVKVGITAVSTPPQ